MNDDREDAGELGNACTTPWYAKLPGGDKLTSVAKATHAIVAPKTADFRTALVGDKYWVKVRNKWYEATVVTVGTRRACMAWNQDSRHGIIRRMNFIKYAELFKERPNE